MEVDVAVEVAVMGCMVGGCGGLSSWSPPAVC